MPHRVVSLIPSATEIVAALGAAPLLVGRSHECDYPPEVAALPALTAPKVPLGGTSAAIDRSVRRLLEAALAVYRLDVETLRDLAPDLIVTQSQCDVCAVSLADVEAAARDWLDNDITIVSLAPARLDDVWADIETVAAALRRSAEGAALVGELRARTGEIAARAQRAADRPTVACIEWVEPLMAAGNWMPELVGLAGGENLFGETGRHSPRLDWPALAAADPDVIVVMPCGFDLARTQAEVPLMADRPEWGDLTAVRTGRVYLTDGNQYFNRPGPRLAESLEILAEILHPHLFAPRHRGVGWNLVVGR